MNQVINRKSKLDSEIPRSPAPYSGTKRGAKSYIGAQSGAEEGPKLAAKSYMIAKPPRIKHENPRRRFELSQ